MAKSHEIVKLYGLIDELNSSLAFASYHAEKEKIVNLSAYLEALSRFLAGEVLIILSQIYCARSEDELATVEINKYEDFNNTYGEKMAQELDDDIQGFVYRWNNNTSLWINEARVRTRRLERYLVSLGDICGTKKKKELWNLSVDFFNNLSTLLFYIGVWVNNG